MHTPSRVNWCMQITYYIINGDGGWSHRLREQHHTSGSTGSKKTLHLSECWKSTPHSWWTRSTTLDWTHSLLSWHTDTKSLNRLYKTTVSPKLSVQKTIKADRKLQHRLPNAVAAGLTVHMVDVLKHELSPVPLSLVKPCGEMNWTTKAELISTLMTGIDKRSQVPESDLTTCVLIDGQGVIQALG